MTTNYNARIATRGLALSVDAANPASLPTNVRRNLIAQSENFTNATYYSIASGTVTPNAIIAPDGTLTGTLLTQSGAATAYLTLGNINIISGNTYTFSAYVKSASQSLIYILLYNFQFGAGVSNVYSLFNLATVTATAQSGSPIAQTITSAGNGWYRISMTATANATTSLNAQFLRFADPGVTSTIYCWGAQLEYSTAVSTYYPVSAPDSMLNTRWNDVTGTSRSKISVDSVVPVGQQEYTTPGIYAWTAPAGVTSVSVVAVGAGGTAGAYGASGGSLAYKNNITVVPGTSYTVVVGDTNKKNFEAPYSFPAGSSWFGSATPLVASGGVGGYSGSSTVRPTIGSGYDGGGRGGAGSSDFNGTYGYRAGTGGGAGGYTGDGGNGATTDNTAGGDGTGGGGGGGSSGTTPGGGGGVGIYGLIASGVGGQSAGSGVGQPGTGGSGGNSGIGNKGGLYGGGSAAIGSGTPTNEGKSGAVRIIWGTGRSYPSNAADAATVSYQPLQSINVSYGSFVNVTTPILYDSRNSGSLVFNNLDNYVAMPELPSQTNSPLSVFAWVFLNATPAVTNGIWGHYGVNNNNIHYEINPTATRLRLGDINKADLPMLTVGSWQFVGFTSTGSSHSYYVNGALSTTWAGSTGTILGGNGTFPSSHMIGRSDATRTWNGRIAQVAIYTAELTATEVLNNFNALRGRYGV